MGGSPRREGWPAGNLSPAGRQIFTSNQESEAMKIPIKITAVVELDVNELLAAIELAKANGDGLDISTPADAADSTRPFVDDLNCRREEGESWNDWQARRTKARRKQQRKA